MVYWYYMLRLASLKKITIPRPNTLLFEEKCYIPGEIFKKDWSKIYEQLRTFSLKSPIRENFLDYIPKETGFFGFQTHPQTKKENYFHLGISLALPSNTKIFPVLSGILEYSGYGAVNGHYVLLSHPEIQTEDGYVLHSMYCHLKKPLVKFSSYQKMLREISLGSYPLVEIAEDTELGIASFSGVASKDTPTLYLQLSFRKFGEDPIILDPARVFYRRDETKKSKARD